MKRSREQAWAQMPKTALTEEHVRNCKVLPDRDALINVLPKAATVAEFGVFRGEFSEKILSIAKPKMLHLVDAWEGERFAGTFKHVEQRFADEARVKITKAYSTEVIATFPRAYFDWVYIDTNHQFKTTYSELKGLRGKIKRGGFIAGHDFCTGNPVTPVLYGVVQACHLFCSKFDWEFRYITLDPNGHFSFCLARKQQPTLLRIKSALIARTQALLKS